MPWDLPAGQAARQPYLSCFSASQFPWGYLSFSRTVNMSSSRPKTRKSLGLKKLVLPSFGRSINEHRLAQPDGIAFHQHMALNTLAIDVGAIERAHVFQHISSVLPLEHGVKARHPLIIHHNVVIRATSQL